MVGREAADATTAVSPIGAVVAGWRAGRGLTVDQVAFSAGLSAGWLAELEAGREWVDRRSTMIALAAALGCDPLTLAGQPFPPVNPAQAEVHAAAFHLRRAVMTPPGGDARVSLDEVAQRLDTANGAAHQGDEAALARLAPTLIHDVDALSAAATPSARSEVEALHARAHLLAAGLLRRLGFGDLAWTLLLRVEPSQRHLVVAQQAWLLLDYGKPQHALTHAATAPAATLELVRVRALAHAMSGDVHQAQHLLDDAAASAESATAQAEIAAMRVLVAAEAADWNAAAELGDQLHHDALPARHQAETLISLATAEARRDDPVRATAHLRAAHEAAPHSLAHSPYARELLAVLPARTTDQPTLATLNQLLAESEVR